MSNLLISHISLKLPQGARATLDEAVDRLAEIQQQKRLLETEEQELRSRLKPVMEIMNITDYVSASGHKACLYDSKNVSWITERLNEVLTKEEIDYCLKVTPFKAVKIS